MKQSYLFLADGFEEIEALATVDVLRRCGMCVSTVSITSSDYVTGANGVTVRADCLISDVPSEAEIDWLICPGGMPGASNLAASPKVCDMLTDHYKSGGRIAAICASPAVVLAPLGIIGSRAVTCYPGMESLAPDVDFTGAPVESNDTLVTGNGPASTLQFAYAIASISVGVDVSEQVACSMQYAK